MQQTLLSWYESFSSDQLYLPGELSQRDKNLKLYRKILALKRTGQFFHLSQPLPELVVALKKAEPSSRFASQYRQFLKEE